MNSSTLRRLAADHNALHSADLPPYYLFSPDDIESRIPDDLTQLTIFLTGPPSTPYSQGLWKLSLRIPEDYPKSPPKAVFRTRIWHPNVEENTGSVCVDTLKRDWDSKLTLRDVLVTISCLLIYPNPDSALNAAAGRLLQEDYESFARQARLMTSIHASIPPGFKEAVVKAKERGDLSEGGARTGPQAASSSRSKAAKLSYARIKRQPRPLNDIAALSKNQERLSEERSNDSDDDEKTASKENDPSLSPTAVTVPSPKRANSAKRPLSDLPCPVETDAESSIGSSQQNIIVNNPKASTSSSTLSDSPQSFQLVENTDLHNSSVKKIHDSGSGIWTGASTSEEKERPAKRICSDETKENIEADLSPAPTSTSLGLGIPVSKIQSSTRKVSTSSSISSGSGKTGKARVGLRRL